jgi:molybdenum cofactor guanylyltransferase
LKKRKVNVSAVLLAGGESRRIGTDKATLLFRGKPLWQIQLRLLRKLAPSEILISARTDPAWRPDDVLFVADEPPSRGPLSGIAAAMTKMRGTHLLAFAVDMPLMEESFLRNLCDQILPGNGVLPKIGNRAEPLAAIYPREAHGDFRNALRGADFSLQPVVRRLVDDGKLREIFVGEQEKKFFTNLNDLSEFALCSRGR